MKQTIIYLTCFLAIVANGCAKSDSTDLPLIASPTEQSIVTSRDQPKYQVEYIIRNQGIEVIQIQDTMTTCGCTLANIEPRVLEPGKSAIVKAEVDSIPVGSKNVQISIKTSSRTQPEILLILKIIGSGKIPYVANSSSSIPLGQIFDIGQTESFFVETRETEGSKNWLRTPIVDSTKFRVNGSLKEERPMGAGVVFRRYEYQMEITELGKTGDFRGAVSFRVEDRDQTILTLIYNGTIMQAIYTSPSAIFGTFTKFEQIPKYKLVFQHDPKIKALKIEPGLVLHPLLKVEPIDLPGQSDTFLVTITKPFEGEMKTEIIFKTNHSGYSEVRIPVFLRINP